MFLLRDLSVALRAVGKNPGFFAVASLTLALGIGANTAVFSLVEALMLRSLPVARPGELAVLGPGTVGVFSRSDRPQPAVFSYSQYEALSRDSKGVFSAVAAAPTFDTRAYWGDRGEAGAELRRASCQLVTGSYFPLLGIRPFRGRLLDSSDDGSQGANPVAVVSYQFWATRLGSAPDAVGSTIRIQNAPFTIVGIAERPFRGHTVDFRTDIWVPMSMQRSVTLGPSRLEPTRPYETYWLNILGRVRPEMSFEQAETALNARLQEVFLEHAGDGITDEGRSDLAKIRVQLTPMGRGISRVRNTATRPLALLWGATGLLLLVACANLGSLLLARAAGRQHELGVRQALGAGRGNLMRPLLAEAAVVAGMGMVAGCALAYWLVPLLRGWLAGIRGAGSLDARLAGPEFAVAAATGGLAVLLFGVAPAALAARDAVSAGLRAGGPAATAGRGSVRARSVLVGGQCGLAVVLLATAGLFLRTLSELRASDLGLAGIHAVGVRVDPRAGGFAPETQPSMRARIVERAQGLPGVESAAFTSSLPLRGNFGMSTVSVSGYTPAENEEMSVIEVWAGPAYFETLGIHILQGRAPEPRELDALVVNRAFAERFYQDASALGGVIGHHGGAIERKGRIVGVAANVRQVSLRDAPPPIIYRPAAGYEGFLQTLAVRSSAAPERTAAAVREAVKGIAPAMPVAREFDTVALHLERAVALERMLARLVGAFAAVAALLASLGLFGLCSYTVRTRTREIGVRLALGSTGGRVRALVFRQAAIPLGYGAVAGIAGAGAVGQVVSGLLHGAEPFEWEVSALAVLVIAACSVIAAGVPALRAGRIQPAEALRHA